MGRTEVNVVILGPNGEGEFTLLVHPRTTLVGLPAEDIQDLGLEPIPAGKRRFATPGGVVERNTYSAFGRLAEQGFLATVVAATVPMIGYQLLENIGFEINADTGEVVLRGPDTPGPPYLVSQWLA